MIDRTGPKISSWAIVMSGVNSEKKAAARSRPAHNFGGSVPPGRGLAPSAMPCRCSHSTVTWTSEISGPGLFLARGSHTGNSRPGRGDLLRLVEASRGTTWGQGGEGLPRVRYSGHPADTALSGRLREDHVGRLAASSSATRFTMAAAGSATASRPGWSVKRHATSDGRRSPRRRPSDAR